jgi:CHASE2 domain
VADKSSAESLEQRVTRYREKVIEAAILAVPLSLIAATQSWINTRLLAEPWRILWVLVPLAAVTWLTWRTVVRPQQRDLDWRWFVLLALFCSVFALAGASDLLVWKRAPRSGGYYDQLHEQTRGWLAPVWLGDWRYSLVRRAPSQLSGVVLILEEDAAGTPKESLRVRDRRLIELARIGGARGIAFDVAYQGRTRVDSVYCAAVERAKHERSGFRVLSAYDLTPSPGDLLPRRPPLAQSKLVLPCLPASEQGHAMGLAEGDGIVRSIPLQWEREDAPAFSVRIAEALRGSAKPSLPEDQLLRFTAPYDDLQIIEGKRLGDIERSPEQLDGYFLIVGERSPADTFKTPFGRLPGAVVHAYAVHSLLSGAYIRRPAAVWSAFIVFAGCYALTLFAAKRPSPRRLVVVACVLTGIIGVFAAAAIYFWRVWLDVIYGVAAIWLLLPLLIVARRVLPGTGTGDTT